LRLQTRENHNKKNNNKQMLRRVLIAAAASIATTSLINYQQVYAATHNDEMNLVKIQAIFRHGARAPLGEVPNEHLIEWNDCMSFTHSVGQHQLPIQSRVLHSNNNATSVKPGNCANGQLTVLGAIQMEQIGRSFFDRYQPFIESIVEKEESNDLNDVMYVRSTDVSPRRTEQSAQFFLSGFIRGLTHNEHDEWITPTIYRYEFSKETLYPNHILCPAITKLLKHWQNHFAQNVHPRADIAQLTSDLKTVFNVDKLPPFEYMNNGLLMYKIHNKPLPEELTQDHIDQISKIATEYAWAHFRLDNPISKELCTLSIGTFINELCDSMKAQIKNKQNDTLKQRPLEFYFGHDNTLFPVLAAMGVEKQIHGWPPVGSSIEFHLYQSNSNNQNYYVKMLYNGRPLILSGAHSYYCSYSRFQQLCQQVKPIDFQLQCNQQG
jgi:hypothetical protein